MYHLWLKIPQTTRDHIVSAIKTFIAGFSFFAVQQLSDYFTAHNYDLNIGSDVIKAILLAALRYAIVKTFFTPTPATPVVPPAQPAQPI